MSQLGYDQWLALRQAPQLFEVRRLPMKANPYVRDVLPATRKGICDPRCVVESRLDVLSDLLNGWAPHGPDQSAYDFLATLGWLERVDDEQLTELDPDGLIAVGRARRRPRGSRWLNRRSPSPIRRLGNSKPTT